MENTFPIFSLPLTNARVSLMTLHIYTFPIIITPYYGAKTSVSSVEDSATGGLPSFITLNKTCLIIYPKLKS